MRVVQAQIQPVEEIYRLVWTAVENRQPNRGDVSERSRLFCPHRLGRNDKGGFAYSAINTAGRAESGLQPGGLACKLALCCTGETQQGEVNWTDAWRTAPNHSRPASCMAEADIDAEDYPERDPQKGH